MPKIAGALYLTVVFLTFMGCGDGDPQSPTPAPTVTRTLTPTPTAVCHPTFPPYCSNFCDCPNPEPFCPATCLLCTACSPTPTLTASRTPHCPTATPTPPPTSPTPCGACDPQECSGPNLLSECVGGGCVCISDVTPTPTATACSEQDLLPDLVITSAFRAVPEVPPPPGCYVPLISTMVCVANRGASDAGPFSISLDDGGPWARLPGLRAGDNECSQADGALASSATVDSDNEVEERSEQNNHSTIITSSTPGGGHEPCSPTPTPS